MTGTVTFADIEAAHAAIRRELVRTPTLMSRTLSDILGCKLWLKFESLQFTASFKERGALNRLLQLTPEERERGVVAASAGNHAQGLAHHAQRLGIKAVLVMPETAPAVKIKAVRGFGAEVILKGQTFADAAAELPRLIAERGLVLVPAFDDPAIIAGQGTIGIEMLEVQRDLDTLVVPIGGGGLISGIAIAAKAIKPEIRIVGVQSELYPGMAHALGHTDRRPGASASIAEGIAVKEPGGLTREICARLVDEIVVVRESSIEDAVAMLLEIEKSVIEGAGAAGVAAILEHPQLFAGRRVGAVLCGGNIDLSVLSSVLQRTLVRKGRRVRLAVTVLDSVGALAKIAGVIAASGGNIVSVTHERVFGDHDAKSAEIVFDIELEDRKDLARITGDLTAFGMQVENKSQE
ncbi:MAG: threonine ammonia-lyase [Beijerinckiaceae bacterium]